MSVEGGKDLERKLKGLADAANAREAVAKAAQSVRDAAVLLAPTRRHGSGGGALKQSIYATVEEAEDGVDGIVYTNSAYAPYVEFGTGPNGEKASHADVSPDIDIAYSQTGWTIPADAMSAEEAEQYGFGVARKGDEVIGYYTKGQAPQPFLYPAMRDSRETVLKGLQADFEVKFRKATE